MKNRRNEHLNMGEALKEFIDKNRLQKGIDKVDAAASWARLMGNGVNNYTDKVELAGDTLYVSLSSSVLRDELSRGKSKIISMLNEDLGKELVRKIVLR